MEVTIFNARKEPPQYFDKKQGISHNDCGQYSFFMDIF